MTGNLSAWADSTLYLRSTALSNWYLEYSTQRCTLLILDSSHEFLRSDWIRDTCVVDYEYAPCTETLGLFSFDIPFIWGEDLPFYFSLFGGATAVTLDDGLEADAAYDFGHSFVWGGFSNVRVGTTAVTDYDYRSGTGHDWRLSSIDNGPSNLPEPATASLMVLALGGAWWARRRRGA